MAAVVVGLGAAGPDRHSPGHLRPAVPHEHVARVVGVAGHQVRRERDERHVPAVRGDHLDASSRCWPGRRRPTETRRVTCVLRSRTNTSSRVVGVPGHQVRGLRGERDVPAVRGDRDAGAFVVGLGAARANRHAARHPLRWPVPRRPGHNPTGHTSTSQCQPRQPRHRHHRSGPTHSLRPATDHDNPPHQQTQIRESSDVRPRSTKGVVRLDRGIERFDRGGRGRRSCYSCGCGRFGQTCHGPEPGMFTFAALSRDRTRCPRCPASRGTTRRRHRQAVVARVPRRARPVVRIRPQVRPRALHPRARCRPARQDAADS